MERVKIIVYSQSLAQPPVMKTLVQQLESQKASVESQFVTSPDEILSAVEATSLTVLILTLQTKEELVDLLNVLGQVEERIRNGLLRTLILNGVNHPRVISLMKSKGAHEIIDFNCTIKSLNHKIKTAFLVVTQNYQRQNAQQKGRGAGMGGDSSASSREVRSEVAQTIRWLKPVEHPSDFWYLPSVKNLRCVMGRWLMDMLGPGPAAGFWEDTGSERHGEKGWVWKVRVATDTAFQPRSGRWVFYGKQPEFSWQKNLWSFVSAAPFLAFYTEDEQAPEFVRIGWNPGKELEAYENSEVGKNFIPQIQISLEISMKLSKESGGEEALGNHGGAGLSGESDAGPGFVSSGDAPAAGWNDHNGAVGFDFKSKDLSVGQKKKMPMRRGSLSPDPVLGGQLGLDDVKKEGVSFGRGTFEKVIFEVFIESQNGVSFTGGKALRVIELNSDRGTFEFPKNALQEKDRLRLAMRFAIGAVERRFTIDWHGFQLTGVEGAGMLGYGNFTGKGQEDLRQTLQLFDRRENELKSFFVSAKGA